LHGQPKWQKITEKAKVRNPTVVANRNTGSILEIKTTDAVFTTGPTSSFAPTVSRMETFWYRLTQVHHEKWRLKWTERESERQRNRERDLTF